MDVNKNTAEGVREDLSAALKVADKLGLSEGIYNHFSVMHPTDSDKLYLSPTGIHWSEMTPEKIALVDFDGNIIEGDYPIADAAFCVHATLHEMNKNARVVLHTHMPYTTAITTLQDFELLPISQTACRFMGRIKYIRDFTGYLVSQDEVKYLLASVKDENIVFLANHGVIVIGETLSKAMDDLYMLERAAQLQVLALSMNKPLKLISQNIIDKIVEQRKGVDSSAYSFDAMKRVYS